MTENDAKRTIDHATIRAWAEKRGGHPATVAATHQSDDPGILRIDFGEKEETLDKLTWEQFFAKFEESNLAFLYQDETKDGKLSRFFKLVRRSN